MKATTCAVILLLTTGCGKNTAVESLKSDNAELRKANAALVEEVDFLERRLDSQAVSQARDLDIVGKELGVINRTIEEVDQRSARMSDELRVRVDRLSSAVWLLEAAVPRKLEVTELEFRVEDIEKKLTTPRLIFPKK